MANNYSQLFSTEGISLLVAVLLLMLAGWCGVWWFTKKRQKRIDDRVLFAESETAKIFKLITEDVEALSKAMKTSMIEDDDYALARLKDNIKKMETYLKKGIEKIKGH